VEGAKADRLIRRCVGVLHVIWHNERIGNVALTIMKSETHKATPLISNKKLVELQKFR
jgi:hypothetical protein